MLVMVMVFPVLVTGGIEKTATLTEEQIMQQMQAPADTDADSDAENKSSEKEEDPMKALQDSMAKEAKEKK